MATDLDIAVSEHLTLASAKAVLTNGGTWLTSLMYMTTFGFELAVDANLANVIYVAHKSSTFGQTSAGYLAATFGLLNFVTRPVGGFMGDMIYRKYGLAGKKYLTISLGFLQGSMALSLGLVRIFHPVFPRIETDRILSSGKTPSTLKAKYPRSVVRWLLLCKPTPESPQIDTDDLHSQSHGYLLRGCQRCQFLASTSLQRFQQRVHDWIGRSVRSKSSFLL